MSRPTEQATAHARRVRALVLDVDGVLTDAALFYGSDGELIKRFSARDGFGIKMAQAEGIALAILSGRLAPPLAARLRDLGIPSTLVIEGSRDKAADVADLAGRLGVSLKEIAFCGDDLPDLPALLRVGLATCPADAAPEVRERCHYVCRASGGTGAVREVIELLLRARGRWEAIVSAWERGEMRLRIDATPEQERE